MAKAEPGEKDRVEIPYNAHGDRVYEPGRYQGEQDHPGWAVENAKRVGREMYEIFEAWSASISEFQDENARLWTITVNPEEDTGNQDSRAYKEERLGDRGPYQSKENRQSKSHVAQGRRVHPAGGGCKRTCLG